MRTALYSIGVFLALAWSQCSQAQCPDPDNLIQNCGFETDTQGWDLLYGDSLTSSTADSRSGIASGEIDAAFNPSGQAYWFWMEQFGIVIPGNEPFLLGAYLKWASGPEGVCSLHWYFFDGCPGMPLGSGSSSNVFPNTTTWTLASAQATTSADTQCMSVAVSCTEWTGDFTVRADDVYVFPIGIFFDGFESGDTSAWSATVP